MKFAASALVALALGLGACDDDDETSSSPTSSEVREAAVTTTGDGVLVVHPSADPAWGWALALGAVSIGGNLAAGTTNAGGAAVVQGEGSFALGVSIGDGDAGSVLQHVFIEYGQGLQIESANPLLEVDAFTARHNSGAGLLVRNNGSLTTANR